MDKNTFYVTTPIYYVNDKPHIGHAYTTILADVLARYNRLLDIPTFFLTGTDEHGQKVQKAAESAGIPPQEQADRTVVRFQELWKKLDITNDNFIRTTEERHKKVVQDILQDLYDRGEIYRAEYDGWYCVPCERFYMEKDLEEGKCPECHRPVEKIKEANYFFKMSKYQDWLIQYIEDNPTFIQPDYRKNETLGFLRKPLNDLCISRPKSRLAWGIELPFDSEFVTYVWFDALVNYISAIGYGRDSETFERWWPASYHLIGKDILTTHTVYWPTMLKAIGLSLPECIFAHGWWLVGEDKMSKSLGNVVNPMDMAEKYGVDAFRYFLTAEMVLGQDASFTEEAFIRRYNSDLANDLGNLLNRVSSMISRYCEGRIPEPPEDILDGQEEQELWDAAQSAVKTMEEALKQMKLHQGLADVIAVVRAVNRYVEVKQPWTQAKADDKTPLHATLYTAAEVLRVVSGLLYPVLPEKMIALCAVLGLEQTEPDVQHLTKWGCVRPGADVVSGGALFPRIIVEKKKDDAQLELDEVAKKAKQEKSKQATSKKASKQNDADGVGMISYDDFTRCELRTAKIISAEKVEGTAKLLKLDVFMGEERRQIVAGIALHYTPEELTGKTIVVVANLKPAKIRGVESQGMLLAASKGEKLRIITVDGELSSGALVK